MRMPLGTDLKTRTGAPDKDARLKNAYVEVKNGESYVRKRPIAQGGVSIGTGTAQGGIGFSFGGTDYVFTVNGDVTATNTSSIGTTWNVGTAYLIGDHVTVNFVDYWAIDNNTGNNPISSPLHWSTNFIPAVPFSGTYAVFSGTGAKTTLSNGNLTATTIINTGSVNASLARSSIGKSSGKWYFEFTLVAEVPLTPPYANALSTLNIGVVTSGHSLNSRLDAATDGYGIINYVTPFYGVPPDTALCVAVSSIDSYAFPFGVVNITGDVIGIALDMDSKTMTIYRNGVSEGTLNSTITGILYPVVGLSGTNLIGLPYQNIVMANFGQNPFIYSVPPGYNRGLYTIP